MEKLDVAHFSNYWNQSELFFWSEFCYKYVAEFFHFGEPPSGSDFFLKYGKNIFEQKLDFFWVGCTVYLGELKYLVIMQTKITPFRFTKYIFCWYYLVLIFCFYFSVQTPYFDW